METLDVELVLADSLQICNQWVPGSIKGGGLEQFFFFFQNCLELPHFVIVSVTRLQDYCNANRTWIPRQ